MKLSIAISLFIITASLGYSQLHEIQNCTVPLMFTKNEGQWHPSIRYGSLLGRDKLAMLEDGIVFSQQRSTPKQNEIGLKIQENPIEYPLYIGYRFVRPSRRITIGALDVVPTLSHVYKGNEANWKTSLLNYKCVIYKNVWNRIDITYSTKQNYYSQNIVIHPGGNLQDVIFELVNNEHHNIDELFTSVIATEKTSRGNYDLPLTIEKRNNKLCFTSRKVNPNSTININIMFSTYFGGSSFEEVTKILVDHAGNIYLYGQTTSADFPSVNSPYKYEGAGDAYLCKFTCDGKNLLFSAIIGGEKREGTEDMTFGKGESSLYLLGFTLSKKFPVVGRTRSASIEDKVADDFITHISVDGSIISSGYFGHEKHIYTERYEAITYDTVNSYLWLVGETNRPDVIPYITANAFITNPPGDHDILLIRMNLECDSILYATYIGGKSADFVNGFSIDSQGNPIIVGITQSLDYPLKNAVQSKFLCTSDWFVTKMHSSGTGLIYSTYLGCPDDGASGIYTCNDINNNSYVTCTVNGRFPNTSILDSTPIFGSRGVGVACLTMNGGLHYSTFLGKIGTPPTCVTSIAVDSCSNIYITGTTNNKSFPLRQPLQMLPVDIDSIKPVNFISVISSGGEHLLFSTHWGSQGSSDVGNDPIMLAVDRAQCLYFSYNTSGDVPLYNGYQMQMAGKPDVFLSRFHFNFCDPNYLQCSINCVDSVRVETAHHGVFPERFTITVLIKNNDVNRTARFVEGELNLPPGLFLDPASQSTRKLLSPSSLLPGQTGTLSWSVRVDTTAIQNASLPVKVVVSYGDSSLMDAPCLLLSSYCEKDIPIKYYQEIIKLFCDMLTINELKIDSLGSAYVPDPFTVQYTLRNIDTKLAKLKYVELQLPSGFETIPLNDTRKTITPLTPDNSENFTWTIHPRGTRWLSDAVFRIVAIDTNGFEQSRCEKTILFPPIKQEMLCASNSIDTLKYDKSTGKYNPSPFFINFKLENRIDIIQTNVYGEINLAHAPHLILDSTDVTGKTYAYFGANKIENFNWLMHVIRIQTTTVTDTLTMRYRTDYDTTWRSCEMYVVIEKANISALLSCSITASDTIKADVDSLMNNPFRVLFSATNIGIIPAQLQSVTLLPFNDPRIVSLDVGAQHVVPVQVGDSVSASWRVQLKLSRFYREHLIRIIVTDTSGAVVIACEKKIVVEPLDGMSCRLNSIDTIKYYETSHSYKPDPVEVTLRLTNKLDTTLTNIDAMIDLSYAEHLALSKNEIPIKTLSVIGERLSDSLKWNLTIKSNAQSNSVDTIVIKYRLSPNDAWKECIWYVVIEAEKKFARASCNAIGNDSIWYNNPWEKIIPNPILVRYTITNVGTMTLSGCSVAIITPEVFSISPGTDSIQTYNNIISGKSETHEWLLNVNHFFQRDTSVTINWKWSCAEIAQDTTCKHSIIFSTKDVTKLTVTPWSIRFRAKQNDMLPNAQTVSLMTPSNNAVPWTTSATMTWLNVNPQSGSYPENILLQPNTTSLPIGMYNGKVFFTPTSPYQSTDVQVEYEIYTLTKIPSAKKQISILLGQNYPNPVSAITAISFWLTARERTTLKIIDLFGREVATLIDDEIDEGQHSVSFDASRLQSGIYFILLTTRNSPRQAMRVMTVVR